MFDKSKQTMRKFRFYNQTISEADTFALQKQYTSIWLGVYKTLFLFVLFVLTPISAHAASLQFSPSTVLRTVGSTFTVSLSVSSPTVDINAVSGAVSYPSHMLEVVSVSRSSSVVNLWVKEPSFSNTEGKLTFEGIVLNPGYRGNRGAIVDITFRTKVAGSAIITLASSAVLANDGIGTNVLTSIGTVDVSIRSVTPVPATVEVQKPPEDMLTKVALPEIPSVIDYLKEVTVGDVVTIRGVANPGVDVVVKLFRLEKIVQEQKIRVTSSGDFFLTLGPLIEEGVYSFMTYAVDEALNESEISPVFTIHVKEPRVISMLNFILNGLSTVMLVVLALIGSVVAIVFMWSRTLREIKRMRRETREAKQVSDKSFKILRKSVAHHIARLKKVKRKLTEEEADFLKQFDEDLEKAEENIRKEIQDISRK